MRFQIRRGGGTFRLIGIHDGVGNYDHKTVRVSEANVMNVDMRGVGDPYVRCYSIWIKDDSGGYINLDGSGCNPETWKSSHCSCPTATGSKQVRYELSRYMHTPYTGKVVVAVSLARQNFQAYSAENRPIIGDDYRSFRMMRASAILTPRG